MMIRYPWDKLTPREVFDALRSVPKVAGPWKDIQGNQEARFDHRGKMVTCRPKTENRSAEEQAFIKRLEKYPNIHTGEPRILIDAGLRELGWILVDEPEKP